MVIAGCSTCAVNLTAFEIRFTNTWLSSDDSPYTGGSGSTGQIDRRGLTRRSLPRATPGRHRGEVDGLPQHRRAADPRERQQVVDQLAHAPRVDLDAIEMPLRGVIELVGVILFEDLHEAGDRAQRRAQIVRDRITERFELAIGGAQFGGPQFDALLEIGAALFDLLRHGVERIGEPADLVFAIHLDVHVRPRFGHRFGGLGDAPQRRGDAARAGPARDRPRTAAPCRRWPASGSGSAATARARRAAEIRSRPPTACRCDRRRPRKRARHAGALVFPQPAVGAGDRQVLDRRRRDPTTCVPSALPITIVAWLPISPVSSATSAAFAPDSKCGGARRRSR